MVLTVTLTAGLAVAEGRRGVRQLLLAAIGSCVAWGIIDATMYIMNCMLIRRGRIRLVEAVQHAADTKAALVLIQHGIEPELQKLLPPEEAEAFDKSVLKHITGAHIAKKILTKGDFYGALGCFWLVFVSCLPAAIPFLIFHQPQVALRVSKVGRLRRKKPSGRRFRNGRNRTWARRRGSSVWRLKQCPPCAALATIAGLAVCESLGGIAAEHPLEITSKTDKLTGSFHCPLSPTLASIHAIM
jgi:hypothetical protein